MNKKKDPKHRQYMEIGIVLLVSVILFALTTFAYTYGRDIMIRYFGKEWPVDISQVLYQTLLLGYFMIILLIVLTGRLIIINANLAKENQQLCKTVEDRNKSIEDLNMLLNNKRVFDAKLDIWGLSMLPDFLAEYESRNILPVVLIKVYTTLSEKEFAGKSSWLLPEDTLTFKCADQMFIFMIREPNYKEAEEVVRYLYTGSIHEKEHLTIRNLKDCKQIEEELEIRIPGLQKLNE